MTVLDRTGESAKIRASAAELGARFDGQVILPGDAGYDQARAVFLGGIDSKPAVIIRVANAGDVQEAIRLARETGSELTVRSGGHSGGAYSTVDGGIVIDCRALKAIEIDPQGRTAWAGAGVTAAELTAEADRHDLVIGFGDTGSVGISGITLSGGIGFLVRKFGMTIDNLLAAELVLADGRVVRTDAGNHADLFWAIRGGGGNFGVATRFKYRLQPLAQAYGGLLISPATVDSVEGFLTEAERAPEELSMIFSVMTAPPMPFVPPQTHGKLVVMALAMYAGDTERGATAFAPFRALAAPLVDMVKPIRYREIFFPDDESYHPTAISRNVLLDRLDRTQIGHIIEQIRSFDAPLRAVQLRVLGGAMARIPDSATAFAHRQHRLMANVAAFYTTPEHRRKTHAWVSEMAQRLALGAAPIYAGFATRDDEERIRWIYPGDTYERLSAIKRRYDPDNLFRHNSNIRP